MDNTDNISNESPNIDVKFMIEAISGVVEGTSGLSKATTVMANDIVNEEDHVDREGLAFITTSKPIITIKRQGEYVFVCVDFKKANDIDLKAFFEGLAEFRNIQDEMVDKENEMIINSLIIVPNLYPNINVICMNPIFWAIQPPNVGGELSQIHLIYAQENIRFNVNDIDLEAIEKEEIESIERMAEDEKIKATSLEQQIVKLEEKERLLFENSNSVIDIKGINK